MAVGSARGLQRDCEGPSLCSVQLSACRTGKYGATRPILDGTGSYIGVRQNFLSENGMGSETHIFNPNLVNEIRFSYNWGKFSNLQENYNVNLSAQLGLG